MNTMSLLRNSVIVGGATFLVGSAFMGISKADSKSDIGKWPYIATFLSGALGFYLLKQEFVPVPKALELNADYTDSDLSHFGKPLEDGEEFTTMQVRIGSPSGSTTSWTTAFNLQCVGDDDNLTYFTGLLEDSVRDRVREWNGDELSDFTPMQIVIGSPSGSTTSWYRAFTVQPVNVDLYYLSGEIQDLLVDKAKWWNSHEVIYDAEYDFKNQAITTVIADEEDEAWEKFPHVYDSSFEDWEIVDIREADIDYSGAKGYVRALDGKFDGANDEGYFPVDEEDFSEMVVDEIGEHTTLDAESSSSLQSFAAEVFMADRKIRRRTRWTWTRSMEDGFDYSNMPYAIDSWNYRQDGAYHISDLPEGYHLHLYKPKKRSRQWIAYAKHPQSDKWDKFYARNKAYLTPQLLEWYNLAIATPTKQEMSPIMQMLIDTGSASGDVKISRVVIPEVPRMKKMPDGTKQKVGVLTSEQIKFYATKPNEKPQILATKSGSGYDFSMSENGFERLGVLAFMQGLAFIGSQAGTTRSVNRFNKNPEAWVKSYPAWFQNTVKNKINHLRIRINTMNRFNNILSNGSNIEILINNVTVATLNRGEKFYSRQTPTNNTKWIEDFEKLSEPKIKVMGEEYPPIFILNEDGEFDEPRPSTQRKIYQNSMILQDDGTYQINPVKFLMEITDRYKFENQTWLNEMMSGKKTANLDKQSQEVNGTYQPIMKTMLRRFKKKLN